MPLPFYLDLITDDLFLMLYKVVTSDSNFTIEAGNDEQAAFMAQEQCACSNYDLVDVVPLDTDTDGLDGDSLLWL